MSDCDHLWRQAWLPVKPKSTIYVETLWHREKQHWLYWKCDSCGEVRHIYNLAGEPIECYAVSIEQVAKMGNVKDLSASFRVDSTRFDAAFDRLANSIQLIGKAPTFSDIPKSLKTAWLSHGKLFGIDYYCNPNLNEHQFALLDKVTGRYELFDSRLKSDITADTSQEANY